MTSFNTLYSQFLSTVRSYTLSELSDYEIQAELFNLANRAIANFKFPKIKLDYQFNETEQIHEFVNDITQKELNVLLAHMKVAWIEEQISREEKFANQYYDSNVRTFSMGAMLAQLNRMNENFVEAARRAEYDYSRVATDGRPRIGDINV